MNLKNPKPRYVKIDPKNPSPIGVCDDSGFVFNKEDLEPQMEWRGDRLVPTGFMRGKPFIDEPQPQLKTPDIKADPYPIKDPRLPQPSTPGYYPEGLPAPPNEEIKTTLEQVQFTTYTDPDKNPLAPKGAPDGIPVPDETTLYNKLLNVTFNR